MKQRHFPPEADIFDLGSYVDLPTGFAGHRSMSANSTWVELQKLHIQGRISPNYVVMIDDGKTLQLCLATYWSSKKHSRWLAMMAGWAVQQATAPLLPFRKQPELKFPSDVTVGGQAISNITAERMAKNLVAVSIDVRISADGSTEGNTTNLQASGVAVDPSISRILASGILENLLAVRNRHMNNPLRFLMEAGWTSPEGKTTLVTDQGDRLGGRLRKFGCEQDTDEAQIVTDVGEVLRRPMSMVVGLSQAGAPRLK